MNKRKRPLVILLLAVFLLSMFPQQSVALSNPGAIWTTDSTGRVINGNVIYQTKNDVYLNGGPEKGPNKGLPDGQYYIKVTEPDGTLLGTSIGKSPGTYTVKDGRFINLIQLYPATFFKDTSNPGGEYKVWVSKNPSFPESQSKTDNFKIKKATSQPPVQPPSPPSTPPTQPPIQPPIQPPSETSPQPSRADDVNKGGVTPPPSESVTPLQVKITPDRVPAGDPTITVKSDEPLNSVYALLPDGTRLDLKYIKEEGFWKVSFLVPFGTPDGPYQIKIFTVNRQKVTHQYNYTIIIDNRIPLLILDHYSKEGKLFLNVSFLFPVMNVTAKFADQKYPLYQKNDLWSAVINIPADLKPGNYEVVVTGSDGKGHSATAKFTLPIKNESKNKVDQEGKSAAKNTPEINIKAKEFDKTKTGAFFWGIPPMAAGVVYSLMRRRKR